MNFTQLLDDYILQISNKFSFAETTELGYRTDFELLLKNIFDEINVKRIDHDARTDNKNKPDFIVRKNNIPILFIETKDIGVSLDKIEKTEQMSRYYGYSNLILTDYLEFRFYRNGYPYQEPIIIGTYDRKNRTISPSQVNFEILVKTIQDFATSHKEPIKSGLHLARVMGGKAFRIRENVRYMLKGENATEKSIYKVYESIKQNLIHDLDLEKFADMYAQTLVYGLFVARFHDGSPDSFSRQEARDLVPKSNPLLQHFFDHIVGPDFDKALEYIVNELCEVFSHADIHKLMNSYYNKHKDSKDPVIHFYEDFLDEYDPVMRKEFGAYYTPLPVVSYIVRSVDKILEKEFSFTGGLANNEKVDKEHIVQILDPATGTGTF